ncbi:MAG TPA: DUF4838 domain-containing protein, partial [Gemmataceae bacterium]|nr:DUF4838 domain-containing protein [Gemmataceae bacterium]
MPSSSEPTRRAFLAASGLGAVAIPFSATASAAAAPVRLATGGKPQLPIIVVADAPPRVRQAAADLAAYLGKIAGGPFEVKPGDGAAGIAVGLPAHFPMLRDHDRWAKPTAADRENYLIRTHAKGAYLLGATDLAVEHAVWDFLHRLGYRQFFPGERWEVVPKDPDLAADIDTDTAPAYRSRRIWYGFGPWDYAAEPYAKWCARNRATAGMELHTGHSYGGIIRANQKEFDTHPEYFPLIDDQRRPGKEAKFCISNPGLRKLVVAHVLASFRKDPKLDSVSLDPSDGGGWCECEPCQTMGSVSDRVLTLANEAAAAANAEFKDKYVGIYAYAYHSPPPSIRVHPNVVVSIATAFLKGGLTLDEIIDGWAKQGATLGIREYYSVNTWDRDLPGHARGSNLDYLRRTIPAFHAKGARFMSAESSDNWGPNGLGYYLAARALWDVSEATRADAIADDFLTRSFGPAKEPMREFYRQLDGSKPHLVADDQLGRMFRALAEARRLADAAIRSRIDDLVLYAWYVSLYTRYAAADGPARQQAFEALIRHAYRMRKTMLVHAKALYRDLAGRDKTVTIPPEARWDVAEGKNPWKSSAPFTAEEIEGFVADGIKRHPLVKLDFEPVKFGTDLVPAAGPLNLKDTGPGELGPGRGVQTFLTYIEKGPATIELAVTGGLIAQYRDRGNVKIELTKLGGPSPNGEKETLVATDRSTLPDGKEYPVKLAVKEPGLYRLTVSDGMDRTLVRLKSELPFTVPSSAEAPMNAHHLQWMLYFYVPRGTKVIGLFGGEHGEVQDPQNRTVFWLNGRKPNYYGVPVPDGQDGKMWRV